MSDAPKLEWRRMPSDRWLAATPLGEVSVALRRGGKNRGNIWTAILAGRRVRIATGANSFECQRNAEFHVDRLTKKETPNV